ncbi:MAG: universal stress protein [Chlorobiaceae bacterium]|nr:universal stress protein [Chlorobiaceae bacterium]NTV26228.1 universal stress protein [Chlorobiaceae bacterium]
MTDNKHRNLRTILCPVDFSAASERALIHAAERHSRGTELVILHIGSKGSIDRGVLLREHLHHFSRYSDMLSSYNCSVRFAVEYGSPADAIIDYAKTHNIDMIVMGSHGENNIHRLLVGSTTETVMRHAPCPVLVFKAPESAEATYVTSAAL